MNTRIYPARSPYQVATPNGDMCCRSAARGAAAPAGAKDGTFTQATRFTFVPAGASRRERRSYEGGAALITSLLFLTVLTILGMSTLGTALLESRMAGNTRDRNIAFHAAEIGLRDAELFIRNSGRIVGNILVEMTGDNNSDYTAQACSLGLCYNGPTWASAVNWINCPVWVTNPDNPDCPDSEINWRTAIQYQRDEATVGKPVGRVAGVAGAAQLSFNAAYVLPAAPLPLVSRQPEYLIESFPLKPGNSKYYYRITVRGYGMLRGTRVMLQEVYTPTN